MIKNKISLQSAVNKKVFLDLSLINIIKTENWIDLITKKPFNQKS